MFFRKMNEQEKENSRRGMVVGFMTYMLITAVNYCYYIVTDNALFSPAVVFLTGLVASSVYQFILNYTDEQIEEMRKNKDE
ncbi:hypothetical protein NCCP2716_26060 [Sporosarcina sp. NCCP-2716]|uniref:hypothetical protein n=1 Tax=Sporosarcina sp. NCCP-2716 TaxID=2943679 RepID=UPI002041825B|nr:hypothetical protein [Sporosarcina sp. NCCP-2716]GKV70108.1 hypothetical protein NCCP2716_26060 [Sporosarcina sp. NCCP-2716]